MSSEERVAARLIDYISKLPERDREEAILEFLKTVLGTMNEHAVRALRRVALREGAPESETTLIDGNLALREIFHRRSYFRFRE